MPEGDTLHRTAATLQRAIGGQVITRFESAYAHLAVVDDQSAIAGRTIARVRALGKHLLIHVTAAPTPEERTHTPAPSPKARRPDPLAGPLVLRTHMRMSGAWHIYQPGERWRVRASSVRIRIDTTPWVALGVNVPLAEFVTEAALERHAPLARLGPDLLGDTFDAPAAAARLATAGATPVGEALLDQRLVAGIGNVLRSEVLFLAG
ncbi:MAG: DNA-formamidopyrimidine glycosylase family protein, partial [Dehalococcoidia bacterium]